MDFNNELIFESYDKQIKKECFISTLSCLKESSLEAVESSKPLSEFKKYMHIEREVQREFEKALLDASKSDCAELILLCGSVGDGKSHMLSVYNEKFPDIMQEFTIHNDSTASFYLDKPAIYTLREVLDNYTDKKINISKQKLILAINLGTLNNFIEADIDNEFGLLKKYIRDNKILEELVIEEKNPQEHFNFINFADYHLYYLEAGEAKSDYIEALLNKLTVESDENIFHHKYIKICKTCESGSICPVKANYEMLKIDSIRNQVIESMIEAIVKSKLIISTRTLYNFLYEIIVDNRYIKTGSAEPQKEIAKLNEISYCEALLMNNFFTQEESSDLLNSIHKIDPLNVRDEKVDTFIVDFNNKSDILEIFNFYLPEIRPYLKKVEMINFEDFNRGDLKQLLLKLYIRSYYLSGKVDCFELKDKIYVKFVENLYYWNCGEKGKLKELYSTVKDGAIRWNGEATDNGMVVYIGKTQTRYSISQKVDVKPLLSNIVQKKSSKLFRFSNTAVLHFEDNKSGQQLIIELDFTLYDLLTKILDGYRPNMKDKNLNIKFNKFVNQLEVLGSKNEVIFIQEKNEKINRVFKLEHSEDFGYTFGVI